MAKKYRAVFAKGPRTRKSWYRIEAKADTAEVYIYDEIGLWGIDASTFVKELDAVKAKTITLRINSPGGSVFDGIAMYNALRRHPATVESHVDGLAASIASVIALAGDEVHMGRASFFMIHDPSVFAVGTAEDMRKNAELLDQVAGQMVDIYAARSGKTGDEVRDLMKAETWFTAEGAVSHGFATHAEETEETPEDEMAAGWDLSLYANVPVALAERCNPNQPPQSVREVETILRDAGLSRSRATAVASHGWQDKQRDADPPAAEPAAPTEPESKEKQTMKICAKCGKEEEHCICDDLAAEQSRASEILALGTKHNCPDVAAEHIAKGKSVSDMTAAILDAMPVSKPLTVPVDGVGVIVGENNEEARPWGSFGEQLQAVRLACMPGAHTIDARLGLVAAASGSNTGNDSDGGFLVSPQFVPGLIQDMHENDEIVSRCAKVGIGPGHNGIRANGVDETSRATGSRWGGVQCYWASEAGTVTATKPKFRAIKMDLEKLFGLYYATDEIITDATALGQIARQAFNEEIGFATADSVIRGSGAGQPLGILNAGATVSQAKEAGQTADTILFENVSKMWARLRARNRSNAAWFINQECEPQLESMYLAVGTGGVPVWMPAGGVSGAPYATLKGRPVIPVEQCSALGTVGDIILADLSEYLLIDKQDVQEDTSIHVRFIYDEMTYRFIYRVNGQPFRASPITPYKGSATLSPFVTLATRS